jgi:hypothetical protein
MKKSASASKSSVTIPVIRATSQKSLAKAMQTVRPGKSAPLAYRKALEKAASPAAYTRKIRASMLERAGLDLSHFALSGETRLSVRNPYVDGSAGLYFFNVSDYFTDQDRAALFMTNLGGGSIFSVVVHGDAAGARYLLDISVSGAPGLVLEATGGGASATADAKGHALFVITTGSSRDAGISLVVKGTGMYNFHNVVVSRL